MKKFFHLLGLAVLTLGAFDASADMKTITVTVDNPEHLVVRNPADSYNPVVFDDSNSAQISLEYDAPVQANTGWTITSIADAEGVAATNSSLPADGASIVADLVENGSVVYITTSEKAVKTFTIIADHPERILSVDYDYQPQILENDMWSFPVTSEWASVHISINPDYFVTSFKDDKGNDVAYYGSNPSIYCGNYAESTTFYLTTESKDAVRTASLTVNLEGNPEDVTLRRNDGSVVALYTGTQSVAYDPNTENPFSLSHNTYGKNIFKVVLNDNALSQNYSGSYEIYATDGGILDITVDYPDVDVPVNISLASDELEGIINNVTIDGRIIDPEVWSTGDFNVKAGSSLNMALNYEKFQQTSFLVNGAFTYLPIVIDAIDRYDIVVNGERLQDKHITIYSADWQNLNVVYNGETFSMTGEKSEIVLPGNASSLQLKGINNYLVNGVFDYNTNEPISAYNGYIYNLTDGMEIVVELELYQRNELAVIYLQDTNWNYISFRMGYEATFTDVTLNPGYNKVYFNPADLPFQLYGTTSTYSSPVVYLNGEFCENLYGAYAGFDAIKNNDVIMIYDEAVEPYAVTLEIADGAVAEVTKNLVENVSGPCSFDALPGTLVEIAGEGLIVKVNDEAVEAVDGKFNVTVNAEMTISVANDPNTAIGEVASEASNDVYGIDGTLIVRDATPAQINTLPAGLYIVGGKKVMVK